METTPTSNMKRSRRNWGRHETIALLDRYSKRKDEFENSRKKKLAFANILQDLISLDVLEENTTTEMVECRMKSLLRAYKASRDNVSVVAPCVAPYLTEMSEIFGDIPIKSTVPKLDLSSVKTVPLKEYATEAVALTSTLTSDNNTVPLIPKTTVHGVASFKQKTKKNSLRKSYLRKKLKLIEQKNNERKLHQEAIIQLINANHVASEEARERRHQERMCLLHNLFK